MGTDGALHPVLDEGNKHALQPPILDIQSEARGFDDAAQVIVERALAETDTRLAVCRRWRSRHMPPMICSTRAHTVPATSTGGSVTAPLASTASGLCSSSTWHGG